MVKINQIKGKKNSATLYEAEEIYRMYNLNRFRLADLFILIGNDYTPGIKEIDPKKGITLLKHHASL